MTFKLLTLLISKTWHNSKFLKFTNLHFTSSRLVYRKNIKNLRLLPPSVFSRIGPWYYTLLLKFLNFYSHNKIILNLTRSLANSLTAYEFALCSLWIQKSYHFQKTIGKGFFLHEAFYILATALKHKNAQLLSRWLTKLFHKISFWKSRFLISFLRYVLIFHFQPHFSLFKIRGVRVKLKGKISVSGNARTRRLVCAIGQTSFSNFNLQVHHVTSLIRTFTGVQGLQIWLFN